MTDDQAERLIAAIERLARALEPGAAGGYVGVRTITTHADGTVTVTMPQDLVLNAITAQSATFDGDITVGGNQTTAGNQVTTGTTQTKALILDSYTQADVDAGNVPANSLVRIVG